MKNEVIKELEEANFIIIESQNFRVGRQYRYHPNHHCKCVESQFVFLSYFLCLANVRYTADIQ